MLCHDKGGVGREWLLHRKYLNGDRLFCYGRKLVFYGTGQTFPEAIARWFNEDPAASTLLGRSQAGRPSTMPWLSAS